MTELETVLLGHSTSQWFSSMLLGAVSGSVAALVSNPFFLLKSRFQAIGSEDVLHQHVHPSLRTVRWTDGPMDLTDLGLWLRTCLRSFCLELRTAFLDIGRTQAELVCFAMFHCFTHHFSSGTTFFPLRKAPPFVARALEATTMACQPLCPGCQLLRQYGAQGKQSHGPVAQHNLKHEIEACH